MTAPARSTSMDPGLETACPKPPRSEKKPRHPLPKATKPLARGGRPKACNAKRRNREWMRAYGSVERVAFVAALPCIITGQTPCENVHVIGGGMGRKASSRLIVPMIPELHRELHAIGTLSFCRKYGVALVKCAAEVERAWLAFSGGDDLGQVATCDPAFLGVELVE